MRRVANVMPFGIRLHVRFKPPTAIYPQEPSVGDSFLTLRRQAHSRTHGFDVAVQPVDEGRYSVFRAPPRRALRKRALRSGAYLLASRSGTPSKGGRIEAGCVVANVRCSSQVVPPVGAVCTKALIMVPRSRGPCFGVFPFPVWLPLAWPVGDYPRPPTPRD
jgi:hypothetical protein